jgi:hypothetical protein
MIDSIHRCVRTAAAAVVACLLLQPVAASAQSWPTVFDPLTLRTFNLTIDPADWDIRFDLTNEIEVPAQFWADAEAPILVSVRRKSSRALPSEADPIKIGLKIDINELVDGQQWHGLVKLSLENAGDISALREGMAWQLHQFAANAGYYGPEAFPALANWVRVNINGQYVGVYTNVEQRDTQFLRNRGVRVSGKTWLYEIDDVDTWALESGDPHSPAFLALCYQPFAPAPKGKKAPAGCPIPSDAVLESTLDGLIEMDAMLAQGAVDAFADNPDALFSHGKNFFFADFDHSGLKRRYYPWDLDAVFRSTSAGIYGQLGRRVDQSPYQRILLNHPGLRFRYNSIFSALVAPGGPLSPANLHAFLDALQPVLAPALAEDPFVAEDPAAAFAALKNWITARVPSVQSQIAANGPPSPR